jgi:hypothetical protein
MPQQLVREEQQDSKEGHVKRQVERRPAPLLAQ